MLKKSVEIEKSARSLVEEFLFICENNNYISNVFIEQLMSNVKRKQDEFNWEFEEVIQEAEKIIREIKEIREILNEAYVSSILKIKEKKEREHK